MKLAAEGRPVAADLTVSPQHRVLVRSRTAQKVFGTDEVLVAAKQLLLLQNSGGWMLELQAFYFVTALVVAMTYSRGK